MEIEGTYTLQASAEDVWCGMMKREVLLQALPNIESLEQTDPSTFLLTLHVTYPPLIGVYTGRLALHEEQFPTRFRLQVEAEGNKGSLHANGFVELQERAENTIIVYRGTVNLGKLTPLLPRSVFKGGTRLLAQQYFAALSDQLHAQGLSPQPPLVEQNATLKHVERNGAALHAAFPVEEAPATFSRTLARTLRLGGGNPAQEERWARRVRRAGIFSGLLLLVWIGTRLPRRPS